MAHRDLLIGSTLAGYRIESLIGRGGMGSVYLAEQMTLGRRVALKVLAPELAASADFRHRFERESRVAASLDHPHVVPIFESGEADGVLFIAMRFVEGTDLATLLANEGALGLDRAASFVAQIGSALDAAHAKGLVHRDVKPGNVLVAPGEGDDEDYAYLSDFGLTRLTTSDSALTKTGQFMGTVAYAAPEQFEGKPADAMTDLYSLGCVAFECLTGGRPFPRDQEAAVMFAHLQEPPPKVSARRPEAPVALDAVLAKAMAKAPAERFASGRELGAAIRAAIGVESSPGRSGPSAGPPTWVPPAPQRPRPHARRRGAVLAGLVALALVAGTIVVIAVGNGPTDEGAPRSSPTAGPSTVASSPASSGAAFGAPSGLPIRVDTVLRLDPDTAEVVAVYPVGSNPQAVTFSGHAVWVVNDGDATISKLDVASGHVTTRGGISSPCDLFPGPGGGIWVDSCQANQVQLVDPISFDVVRSMHVPSPGAVVSADGSTWAVSYGGQGTNSMLYRFSPSGRREARIELGPESWDATVADDGSVWGNNFGDGTIWRVDPDTNQAEFVPGWTGPDNVVASGHELWIGDGQQHSVTEWDTVSRQTVGFVREHSGQIVVTPNVVWILNSFSDTLTKVDPDTDQILQEFQLGYSSDMVAGDGSLWVSAGSD